MQANKHVSGFASIPCRPPKSPLCDESITAQISAYCGANHERRAVDICSSKRRHVETQVSTRASLRPFQDTSRTYLSNALRHSRTRRLCASSARCGARSRVARRPRFPLLHMENTLADIARDGGLRCADISQSRDAPRPRASSHAVDQHLQHIQGLMHGFRLGHGDFDIRLSAVIIAHDLHGAERSGLLLSY